MCSSTVRAVRDIKTVGAEAVRVAINFSQEFKFLNTSDITKTRRNCDFTNVALPPDPFHVGLLRFLPEKIDPAGRLRFHLSATNLSGHTIVSCG